MVLCWEKITFARTAAVNFNYILFRVDTNGWYVMGRTRITHNICYSNSTYSVTVCTAVHGWRSMCRGVVPDTYITYTCIVYIPNIVYYGCITVPVRLE